MPEATFKPVFVAIWPSYPEFRDRMRDSWHLTGMHDTVMHDPAFARADESDDSRFYVQPRFVEHIDASAIAAVENLYRERFPAGGTILDCMSSWVSHLPAEVSYARVSGLGMNVAELRGNPRLDDFAVHDLNRDPVTPYPSETFDAIGICVSIQYLCDPVSVLRDLARVAKPGAPIVITFSNRCFPSKAVAIWQALGDHDHGALVATYLEATEMWTGIERLDRSSGERKWRRRGDPLHAVVAQRTPFDARTGHR